MILERVNLNHLRVFQVVYEEKGMTSAAEKLHLTQSGISQHIQSLEGTLGLKLFDRVKKRLIPTAAAQALYRRCRRGFGEIESGLMSLADPEQAMQGAVRFGIPPEFGHDMVLPIVGAFQRKYPGVRAEIFVGLAPRLNRLILAGKLDFAFVDGFIADTRVQLDDIYAEVLELCIAEDAVAGKSAAELRQKEFFEKLAYVDYEAGEPLLRLWFENHFKRRTLPVHIRAHVSDARCVSKLILSGVGAGILPRGLLERMRAQGKAIRAIPGPGRPLLNKISLSSIPGRSLSSPAQALRAFLTEEIRRQRRGDAGVLAHSGESERAGALSLSHT